PAHRLHFTASRSSVWSTAGGKGSFARRNQRRQAAGVPFVLFSFFAVTTAGPFALRGIIEIALYGHCVAQSAQPMHDLASISTWPSGKRAIAPVGHPVKHSASLQCRQTAGASRL